MPQNANDFTNWFLDQLDSLPLESWRRSGVFSPDGFVERLVSRGERKEIKALLSRPDDDDALCTVFIPGIMGSQLASVRGISGLLWPDPTIILDGHINLLELGEDGELDRSPDVEVMAVGVLKMIHLRMIIALAKETRLYEFPYDWRKRLQWSADRLHAALERWSTGHPNRRFTLIGHSMGSVVARAYMSLYPRAAERRIERVINIAGLYHGAPQAILMFTGETMSGEVIRRLHKNNDVATFSANMPSGYQLLPPPRDLFEAQADYPANWDLYDAEAWPVSGVRQVYLDGAQHLYRELSNWDPQVPCHNIAGCHKSTINAVRLLEACPPGEEESDSPFDSVCSERGESSGDGTVPLWSACHDKVSTYFTEGEHHMLLTDSEVIDAVVGLVHGQEPDFPQDVPEPEGVLERLTPQGVKQFAEQMRERLESAQHEADKGPRFRP
jgi:pimeloyl-ACP methyl ester carboxylesterase